MNDSSLLLQVSEVVAETPDASSIVFDTSELDYRPGQFLTLRIPSDLYGSVARCYSLSSSPYSDEAPQVTVKRDRNDGYASNWLCDNVKPGMEIEVLPASGVFTPTSLDENLLLIAAGSGITPIMSIVKSVLGQGTGKITLLYANPDEHSVIFAKALRELTGRYPDRLHVVHWLESLQGLPSTEQLHAHMAPLAGRETFVCGPRPFMKSATAAFKELDVPRSLLHRERFVSLGGNPFDDLGTPRTVLPASSGQPAPSDQPEQPEPSTTLTVDLDGTNHTLDWPRQEKLLDNMLEAGLDAPYSCREGRCSACACRVTSGEVTMLHNEILESEDLEEGIVLACQSLPLTEEVSISYE